MLFEHCAQCRRCCNVDPGEPALEITLTARERKTHGSLCVERTCRHLGAAGCVLGEEKPFSCKLYPLAYDPHSRIFRYDVECPLMTAYVAQLRDPASEASAHLDSVRREVLTLEKEDSPFLQNNFAIDSDYFDLRELKYAPLAQVVAKRAEHPVLPGKVEGSTPSGPTILPDRQRWTRDDLWVTSDHNGIAYYTCQWDALCPYMDVNEDMLNAAPKPFLVYGLPPEGPYGVPINDSYGLVNVAKSAFWDEARRSRKFRELEKQYRKFEHSESVIPGRDLTVADIHRMGSEHFSLYCIDDREVAGFADYISDLEVVILRVHAPAGELVLTDVSVLLPERNQIYGSFCQWNKGYRNRSPGIYACLLACRWAARNGYQYYNLGPVGDYGYKSLFVTDYEPLYGIALVDEAHPLTLDPTSPLYVDFSPQQWNQVLRPVGLLRAASAR